MKKHILYRTIIFAICLVFIFCNTILISAANQIKLSYIKLNDNKNLYLEVGDTVNLNVSFYPNGATYDSLEFSSSKEEIAKVSPSGVLKALKSGTSTITATANGNKKATITVTVYTNDNLKASFSETELVKDKIINITINVTSKIENENEFYIFLPTGYMVKGANASFAADKNGTYPFTVYDSSGKKKTFYYEIKKIKDTMVIKTSDSADSDTIEKLNYIYNNFVLQYDYEKKQLLFNVYLDSTKEIVLPNNSVISTNEINYYISNIENGIINDYNFVIDNIPVNCKLIKQGEFYLLMLYQHYNDIRNLYTTNKAYNFTINEEIHSYPDNLFISENDTYDITVYSDSGLIEIFSLPIDNIDYMKPKITLGILYDNTLELDIADNMSLDYIITYDGKYIDIPDSYTPYTTYVYNYKEACEYSGTYLFIVGDKSGNRSVSSVEMTNLRRVPYIGKLNINVHNSNTVVSLFKETGSPYDFNNTNRTYYKNIFPAYMKGISSDTFSPNGLITRAQMVTILCRVNNLPYDINLISKSKFTDINNHWAINYICMGSSKKYIQGYKDKTFRPDANLTRAEFCKMICNISALKSSINAIPAVNNYSFTDINSCFAKSDILKLANRDIIAGIGENFYPDKPITRAEVVYALNRIYKLNPSSDELKHIKSIYNNYYSFKDIEQNPYYNDILIAIVGMYREK